MEEINQIMETPLTPATLRGLGDRSYDKRKVAALEVTALIKSLQEAKEYDRVANVIALLAQEFARSRNIHHRKGGLIGLAASAIGLVLDIDRYLHLLVPPVLGTYYLQSIINISSSSSSLLLYYFIIIIISSSSSSSHHHHHHHFIIIIIMNNNNNNDNNYYCYYHY